MDNLTRIAKDYEGDRHRFSIVVDGIERAVRASFGDGKSLTRSETAKRTDICARWFNTLRYEYGWSTMRAADALTDCLVCELNGIDYKPSDKDFWLTDGNSDRDRIILLG